jgi:hypothetical protein
MTDFKGVRIRVSERGFHDYDFTYTINQGGLSTNILGYLTHMSHLVDSHNYEGTIIIERVQEGVDNHA